MKELKRNCFLLVLGVFILCTSCSVRGPQYLIGGSGWKQIALVDSKGQQLWSHQLEDGQECNSVTNIEGKKILYTYKQGVKLIDKEHNVLWEYCCENGAEIHSASVTKEGNILVGECGHPSKIYEFSSKGEKLMDISFESGVKRAHGQFRRVYKTTTGTYLVPVLKKKSIYEIDKNGQILRKVEPGFSVFSLVLLESGNWLLSCGDAHKLVEFDPSSNQIVWELNENDVESVPLRFVAEAVRLQNGNTIICNWGGHSKGAKEVAQVFEINQDKELIWKIENYEQFGHVSTLDPIVNQKYYR